MKLISSKYFPGPFLATFIDNGVLMLKTLFVVLFVLMSPYSGFVQSRGIDIYRSLRPTPRAKFDILRIPSSCSSRVATAGN